jgi:hypothetical protein
MAAGMKKPAAAVRHSLDVRHHWQLDPALREALPKEWMRGAYDRWRTRQKGGEREEDRLAGWVIETLKARCDGKTGQENEL